MATIGDTITLMLTLTNTAIGQAVMALSPAFYYTFCGEVAPSNTPLPIGDSTARTVITFTFDGDLWVCTLDNC